MPWRTSWEPGWENAAHERIVSDPLNMIFGQVVHGGVMANLIRSFGIISDAVIGYSLGESAGLFAMGAWPDRGQMLKRMLPPICLPPNLPARAMRRASCMENTIDEDINWCAAVVNRPAEPGSNNYRQMALCKAFNHQHAGSMCHRRHAKPCRGCHSRTGL